MRLAYGVNYTIRYIIIVTVVISLSRSLLFLCLISFSYIPTYINAFYALLSRQIESFQPTGNSSAILSNSGERVPAVELTIKSLLYKICQRQKIGCYKNGSQKYCGRVFECYKVQIFVWSQTSNMLQVHSRRILMVKQQH